MVFGPCFANKLQSMMFNRSLVILFISLVFNAPSFAPAATKNFDSACADSFGPDGDIPIKLWEFSQEVVAKIQKASPQFDLKANEHLELVKREDWPDREFWKLMGGPKRAIKVYRGIHLQSLRDYNPNYGLFVKVEASNHLAGAIDVTTDIELARSFARSVETNEKGLVIHYEVPVMVLGPGRGDDAYKIGSWHLAALGILDLQVFQTKIEFM